MGENHRLTDQFYGAKCGFQGEGFVNVTAADRERAVPFCFELEGHFVAQIIVEFGDPAANRGGKGIPSVGGGESWIKGGPAAAGQVRLDPGMFLGLGDQGRIIERIGRGGTGRHKAAEGWIIGKHTAQNGLGVGSVQGALAIGGRNPGRAQKGNEQASLVSGVAGCAPQRTACAAQGAFV